MKKEFTDVVKKTGTFQSFDGTSIYYEVRGEGRPLILCYGIACLINHWTHQLRYFSGDYQTIVFDYRGHHESGTPADRSNLTIDAICRDIQGLMRHLNIPHASFWGHSYGVQILLRLYEQHPELVENFVFINGFATNPIKDMFGVDVVQRVFNLLRKGYRSQPALISKLWRNTVGNPLAIPFTALAGGFNLSLTRFKDIEVYIRGVAAMDLDVFIAFFDEMTKFDATNVLNTIGVPTLIIAGKKDGVTPLSHQIRMHERIHGSELLCVPYGSHCTQLDLPDFVNLRIEKFLNELGYRPHQAAGQKSKGAASASKRRRSRPWDRENLPGD